MTSYAVVNRKFTGQTHGRIFKVGCFVNDMEDVTFVNLVLWIDNPERWVQLGHDFKDCLKRENYI